MNQEPSASPTSQAMPHGSTDGFGETAQGVADQAKDTAGKVVDQAKDAAGQVAEQAKQQATSQLESQKKHAVDTLVTVDSKAKLTCSHRRSVSPMKQRHSTVSLRTSCLTITDSRSP